MTYEDVLKQYKLWYERGFNHYDMPSSEALVMMGKACEKQIPKKPKKQVRGVYDEDNGDWMYDQEWNMCPTCRKRNEVYRGWKYCPVCGQAINWSEVEE